jgi:hypothetical protein
MTANVYTLCAECLIGEVWIRPDKYQSLEFVKIRSPTPPIKVVHAFERTPENTGYVYQEYLKVSDSSGLLYSVERQRLPDYNSLNSHTEVILWQCVNPCSEYEILCESENYPGWACKPLEPMSNTVVKMHQQLR